MKRLSSAFLTFSLFLLFCFLASAVFAEDTGKKKESEEKEQPKLLNNLDLNSMNLGIKREAQIQEEVSVEAPEYPGLDISFQSPAESLTTYKPFTRQELQAYSDLLTDYHLADYDRSELARPHKPARLIRTTIPIPDEDSDE